MISTLCPFRARMLATKHPDNPLPRTITSKLLSFRRLKARLQLNRIESTDVHTIAQRYITGDRTVATLPYGVVPIGSECYLSTVISFRKGLHPLEEPYRI